MKPGINQKVKPVLAKEWEKLIVKQQANGVIPRAKKEWSEIFPEQR